MEAGVSVLIVAGPGSLQTGLRALLSSMVSADRIQVADSHRAAGSLSARHKPTLALLGSRGTDEQVWITLQAIKAASPQTRCIVLVEDVHQLQAGAAEPADALLLQGTSPEELVATIEGLLAR
jgi:DNA-binding NarL/FixJ family response regulator